MENTSSRASVRLLEVCVDSFASAFNAQQGGAARIELCSSLSEGGLTPSYGLIEVVRQQLSIDVFVLIRPRRGDFLYRREELEIIKKDIAAAKRLGANGVVLGVLKKDGRVDVEQMQQLIALAHPLPITFHRAFDVTPDPYQALDDLLQLGIPRLLTSGQQATALQGAGLICKLIQQAGKSMVIMPGSGVDEGNITTLMAATGAHEYHASARGKVQSSMAYQRKELYMAAGQGLSEYENLVADTEKIAAICQQLEAQY